MLVPLKKENLPQVPFYIKWSGYMNDKYCSLAMEKILVTRSDILVTNAWKKSLIESSLVQPILDAIGAELAWKYPLFIPEDECFIVMKMWWHGIADCMERERCIWSLERIFGKKVPTLKIPTMMDTTLEDFLKSFL